ncbi:MAG: hypothetical protein AAB818_00215 [Patescibacteria group bacterium]
MNGSIVKFGDVFRHNEEDYVFLAQTDEIIYAAKILDKVITDSLKNMSDKIEATNSSRRKNPVYSFVILQTENFRDRVAHFGRTDDTKHQTNRFDIISNLNKADCLQIKNEIISRDSAVSLRLIEIVRGLNIA